MTDKRVKVSFILGGILLYLVFLIYYINDSYPWIGHDYRLALAHLLDTHLHYLEDGFTIQWFTPSFGGGLPAFANPEQIQFSLTQLLVLIMNPWMTILLSIVVYSIIGFFASYRFARDILKVEWMAAVLGGLFFLGTGFYIQHNSTGPMTGQLYPLIALFCYLLLSGKWNIGLRGIIVGLIIALFIHSSGFYLFIILGLSLLMIIPLVYLMHLAQVDLKNLGATLLVGGLVSMLLSAGKLYAIQGFMMHFPRNIVDHYYSNFFEALAGFIVQLVGVPLFTVPFRVLRDDPTAVGQMMTALVGGGEHGLWEMDVSISPVLVYILLYQLRKAPARLRKRQRQNQRISVQKDQAIALLVLTFGTILAFEFTTARGFLYEMVSGLPVLSSLHVNIRYAAAFVFPLAMLGAFFYQRELSQFEPSRRLKVFSFFYAGTLLWLGVYIMLPNDLQSRNFNLEQTLTDYRMSRKGEHFFVAEVVDVFDYQVFSNHATSLFPYEPIFGYHNEEFLTKLKPGSIYLEEDGYYNLTNPRSLVYDTDELFARFTLDQREMMEEFAHYRQPDWDIPEIQHILNRISGGTFIFVLVYGAYYFFWGRKRERTRSS